jgi:glycosyltransferase involved in cell wall biosynthesis
MNILFVWDGDYPWDIRVEKVCNSLIRAGHEIHLVCRNLKRQARTEKYKGLNLHRIKCLPKIFGTLNNVFTFPLFLNPIWLFEIYKQAKQNSCKIIITRDLPMAPASIMIGKWLRIPIVLDMAECYPEMLRCVWKFERTKLLNVFIRNPFAASLLEKHVINKVNTVIVMIEESRDRLIKMKIDPNKVAIVSNTPEIDKFQGNECPAPVVSEKNEELKIVYVGLLNASRGMDTVLLAVKDLASRGKSIKLVVAGSGNDEKRLKAMVNELQIAGYVEFLGWVNNERVPELIHGNNICVVPHHKCSHWDATIPNKLFDYMAAGKPVIVTDVTPMKRIVEQEKCGLVYKDYNVSDLAEKLEILEKKEIRDVLGSNGRKAIQEKYRWDIDEKVLIKTVESFVS